MPGIPHVDGKEALRHRQLAPGYLTPPVLTSALVIPSAVPDLSFGFADSPADAPPLRYAPALPTRSDPLSGTFYRGGSG